MPMFYMMVGLPGSGKSFTAESIPNAVVHSSDAIRSLIVSERSTNMICVQYVFSWRRPMRCVWSATIIGDVLSRSL